MLYLTRADQFEDAWEGALGGKDAIERQQAAGTYDANRLNDKVYRYSILPRLALSNTFVSCWYLSDDESDAMWKLYTTKQYGVAIVSTAMKLSRALRLPARKKADHPDLVKPVRIAPVRYVDYKTLATNFEPEELFLYKRKSFAHEREVRVYTQTIVQGEGANLPEVRLPVDIKKLVSAIHVSPYAQPWFGDVVREVVDAFAPGIAVRHSDLAVDPIR